MSFELNTYCAILAVLIAMLWLFISSVWKTRKQGNEALDPFTKIQLQIHKSILGEESALKRESELTSPKRLRRDAIIGLFFGFTMLAAFLFIISGLIFGS